MVQKIMVVVGVSVMGMMMAGLLEARPPFKCLSATVTEAYYGEEVEYDVMEGLASTKRRSLHNVKKLTPEEGCFFGKFKAGDRHCIVLHIDKTQAPQSADQEWQCVDTNDPSKVFARGRTNGGYDTQNLVGLGGKDFGFGSVPSNNRDDAAKKYADDLAKQNRRHKSYCMHTPSNKFDELYGKTIYCQFYDKQKAATIAAFEYEYK